MPDLGIVTRRKCTSKIYQPHHSFDIEWTPLFFLINILNIHAEHHSCLIFEEQLGLLWYSYPNQWHNSCEMLINLSPYFHKLKGSIKQILSNILSNRTNSLTLKVTLTISWGESKRVLCAALFTITYNYFDFHPSLYCANLYYGFFINDNQLISHFPNK